MLESNNHLTDVEENILAEARKLLGANLTDFLLSGLGQTSVTHHRAFTAQSAIRHDEIIYQLEMFNDSEQGLPRGRDPLVMALLLNLLHEGMRMDDTVDFNVCDILKTLGWSQTPEPQLLIKLAVERYASTIYCLTARAVREEETQSHFQRLLISYETVSKPLPEKSAGQLSMKVKFFPAFIYHIHTHRKTFLGIDFSQLQELREISR